MKGAGTPIAGSAGVDRDAKDTTDVPDFDVMFDVTEIRFSHMGSPCQNIENIVVLCQIYHKKDDKTINLEKGMGTRNGLVCSVRRNLIRNVI